MLACHTLIVCLHSFMCCQGSTGPIYPEIQEISTNFKIIIICQRKSQSLKVELLSTCPRVLGWLSKVPTRSKWLHSLRSMSHERKSRWLTNILLDLPPLMSCFNVAMTTKWPLRWLSPLIMPKEWNEVQWRGRTGGYSWGTLPPSICKSLAVSSGYTYLTCWCVKFLCYNHGLLILSGDDYVSVQQSSCEIGQSLVNLGIVQYRRW